MLSWSGKQIQTYPDDVFIATYPKCGNTWVRHIICQLMLEDYKPRAGKELNVYTRTIEDVGKELIDRMPRPRIFKSHYTYNDHPKHPEAKYVLVVRNPKDVVVSAYHMCKNLKLPVFEGFDFNGFFELFMAGKYDFGSYFDYHKEWFDHMKDHNLLLLKYEDIIKDHKGSVVKIGEFLGGRAGEIVENLEKLAQVVEASTFKSMKEDQRRWVQDIFKDQNQFVRKGTTRDWKNHFSKEQSDRMDEKFKEEFKGTIAENWWQEEMKWED
ncbi:hypothetical protein L596_019559 [Steinernema carpocapsae]|uniref:Sulfotransferase domain-containing protein n=1 Tax=Steinernema carpocapsae TaxID=34508 RepID=A0A4U5MQV4_STECR|nr:hypothetical protein L596_019559 [Steinernema carpocapsae]